MKIHHLIAFAAVVTTLALSGCSKPEAPLITMCQKVTIHLVGHEVNTWMKAERIEIAADEARVDLAFPTGISSCFYTREEDFEGGVPGQEMPFNESPYKMTLNGHPVSDVDMLKASARATGTMMKDMAQETGQRASELAEEADKKAHELADQAGEKLRDLTRAAGDKLKEVAGEPKE